MTHQGGLECKQPGARDRREDVIWCEVIRKEKKKKIDHFQHQGGLAWVCTAVPNTGPYTEQAIWIHEMLSKSLTKLIEFR
jgi:hypothetical protein